MLTKMDRIYQTMRKTDSARVNQAMCKRKRKMDWLHPDHVEKKNGLVASRTWRKEKWTGYIQTMEKRRMV